MGRELLPRVGARVVPPELAMHHRAVVLPVAGEDVAAAARAELRARYAALSAGGQRGPQRHLPLPTARASVERPAVQIAVDPVAVTAEHVRLPRGEELVGMVTRHAGQVGQLLPLVPRNVVRPRAL